MRNFPFPFEWRCLPDSTFLLTEAHNFLKLSIVMKMAFPEVYEIWH